MLNKEKLAEAAATGNTELMNVLLTDNDNLRYVDEDHKNHTDSLNIFTQKTIKQLERDQQAAEGKNQVFRVDRSTVIRAFYILRHLIRRNDPSVVPQLQSLLSILDINQYAHQAVSEEQPNELLRLALRIGNVDAVKLLMTIPRVSQLSQNAKSCGIEEWLWVAKQPWLETEPAPQAIKTPRSWASVLGSTTTSTQPIPTPAASESYALEKHRQLAAYTPWATWLMQATSKQPTVQSWAERLKNKPSI